MYPSGNINQKGGRDLTPGGTIPPNNSQFVEPAELKDNFSDAPQLKGSNNNTVPNIVRSSNELGAISIHNNNASANSNLNEAALRISDQAALIKSVHEQLQKIIDCYEKGDSKQFESLLKKLETFKSYPSSPQTDSCISSIAKAYRILFSKHFFANHFQSSAKKVSLEVSNLFFAALKCEIGREMVLWALLETFKVPLYDANSSIKYQNQSVTEHKGFQIVRNLIEMGFAPALLVLDNLSWEILKNLPDNRLYVNEILWGYVRNSDLNIKASAFAILSADNPMIMESLKQHDLLPQLKNRELIHKLIELAQQSPKSPCSFSTQAIKTLRGLLYSLIFESNVQEELNLIKSAIISLLHSIPPENYRFFFKQFVIPVCQGAIYPAVFDYIQSLANEPKLGECFNYLITQINDEEMVLDHLESIELLRYPGQPFIPVVPESPEPFPHLGNLEELFLFQVLNLSKLAHKPEGLTASLHALKWFLNSDNPKHLIYALNGIKNVLQRHEKYPLLENLFSLLSSYRNIFSNKPHRHLNSDIMSISGSIAEVLATIIETPKVPSFRDSVNLIVRENSLNYWVEAILNGKTENFKSIIPAERHQLIDSINQIRGGLMGPNFVFRALSLTDIELSTLIADVTNPPGPQFTTYDQRSIVGCRKLMRNVQTDQPNALASLGTLGVLTLLFSTAAGDSLSKLNTKDALRVISQLKNSVRIPHLNDLLTLPVDESLNYFSILSDSNFRYWISIEDLKFSIKQTNIIRSDQVLLFIAIATSLDLHGERDLYLEKLSKYAVQSDIAFRYLNVLMHCQNQKLAVSAAGEIPNVLNARQGRNIAAGGSK